MCLNRSGCVARLLFVGLLAGAASLGAADGSVDDIAILKAQLAAQQKQLDVLQATIASQQKLLERAIANTQSAARLGEVASLTPLIPPAPTNPTIPLAGVQKTLPATGNPCEQGYEGNVVPTYLRLGNVCIQPVGFMDMTAVWRDRNAGSSIGTNFGSIPFNNSFPAAKNSEFHFSPQNSRIGFRVDGNWKDLHFTGYNEFDFLSSATPGSSGVSNGAVVPRLRLFWIDARKGKLEFLAGQSWSMLVPNRSGMSALPGDLFYSQAIDVNYVAGLTWTRQAGMRVLYHPNDKVTMGLSFENPSQYIGGSAGGSGITLPSALASVAGSQLDNTSGGYLSTPSVMPDIIGKVALDPNSHVHFEMAGLVSTSKLWDPLTNTYSTTAGGGGSVNGNFEIAKGLRVITNNFYGAGGGRYLFGQAPDLVVRADGSLQTVSSAGFVEGLEFVKNKWMVYGYYGDIYIDRQAFLDANGITKVGYGYAGSPNSQNRNIQEFTFGFNQTIWRDARYGAVNVMGQYQYQLRNPWAVIGSAPKSAHDNAIYFNLRYSLPGSMPRI